MGRLHNKSKHAKNNKGKERINQYISGSELNIFDRKEIIQKQNKLRKLYQSIKDTKKIEYFGKIKYQQIIYEIGQYIELYSLNAVQFYIAKLTNIMQAAPELEARAFIEVEWVLKKNDLTDPILDEYSEYISMAEVFPSTEKIYLYVQSIRNKCTLLTIEQYGQLGMTSEAIFYSRSNYDQNRKKLVPDPSTWTSDCQCKKPTNPDLQYVECSKCQRWFHSECVQSKIINGCFMCESCFSNNGLPANKIKTDEVIIPRVRIEESCYRNRIEE